MKNDQLKSRTQLKRELAEKSNEAEKAKRELATLKAGAAPTTATPSTMSKDEAAIRAAYALLPPGPARKQFRQKHSTVFNA